MALQTKAWSPQQQAAIELLALGKSQAEAARQVGVSDRTVRDWVRQPGFLDAVDKVTMEQGAARRAERIRIAQRIVRQQTEKDGKVETRADLIDWLKYVAQETGQWYSSAQVTDLKKKLKVYEQLRYVLLREVCDDCRMKVYGRLTEMADDEAPAGPRPALEAPEAEITDV
jgi:transposase